MLGRTLLFVAGVFGLALAVVPGESEEPVTESPEQTTTKAAVFSPTIEPEPEGWFTNGHALKRAVDGHFYADANIDGASIRMMVDTGASIIALTADDADAAGVQWDPSQVRVIGRGASGDVLGVPARLESVEIGGFRREAIDAVVVPEGLDVSLLGQSYLSKIGSVKIADDTMVMSDQ